MAGQVVRACGSVLAALTIAAGGLMAGTGTAVGESWRQVDLDQILIPPCSIEFSGGPCYEASFQGRVEADDYTLLYGGPKEVDLGAEAIFTLKVNVATPETGEPAPDAEVTSVTHSAPKGFEFVGADVAIWKPGWILETTKYLTYPAGTVWTNNLDATVVVDPATGQVTVTPPAGG